MLLSVSLLAGICLLSGLGPTSPARAVGTLEEIPFPTDEGLGGEPFETAGEAVNSRRTVERADEPGPSDSIDFPDPILRAAVASKIGVSSSHITYRDLLKLQTLTSKGSGITDLTGLEHAQNLSSLYVDNNEIETLEPLSSLTTLRQLTISRNPISDISPLSHIPTINWLEINFTDIDSLEPLSGNTSLRWLQVAYTNITTLAPLANVTSLQQIWFQNTAVSDLSPLAGLSDMLTISAPSARITDLSPLRSLVDLDTVNVNDNHITDISVLESWPNISRVGFNGQTVSGSTAFVPAGAQSYTKQDVADLFSMPFGERQEVVSGAEPTNDGAGASWPDVIEDASTLEVGVSKPIVPGGPAFSADVTFPVERADFTNSALPAAVLGSQYGFTFTTTDGYIDPLVPAALQGFELLSDEVPGLSLSNSGALSGAPTLAGDYPLLVRGTDRHGNTLDREFQLTVDIDRGVAPTIQTASLPAATVGVAYAAQIKAAGTAPMQFAITSGRLPAGLKMTEAGRITGTPSSAGKSPVEVTVKNSAGTDSRTFQVSVSPLPIPCVPARNVAVFADVPVGHKFYTEIDWMHCMKYATGTRQPPAKPLYKPKDKLSREAMAAFIYRLEAPKNYRAPKTSPFADVRAGDPFYKEIAWMWDAKLSTGTQQPHGKPEFRPKERLSREAMAAFIYRLEKPTGYRAPKVSPLADMKPGMKFYTEISWMYDVGLTTGNKVGNTKEYWPKDRLSREAMAAFIHRLVMDYRA